MFGLHDHYNLTIATCIKLVVSVIHADRESSRPVILFVQSHLTPILRATLLIVLLSGALRPANAEELAARYIEGFGGVPLNVIEAGSPGLPTIIFIHGLGQSHQSWQLQLESSLAEEFHLVVYDLRGHGNSGKPWHAEDHAAPETWSGDLERVIDATAEDRPLIVSWSYGTWVAIDYLSTHDPESIRGLVMIGALGGLAPMTSSGRPGDAEKGQRIRAGTRSNLLEENFTAGDEIVKFFMRKPIADEVWARNNGAANALLPPYARPLISQRSFDHSSQVSRILMPTLIMMGSEDPQIKADDALVLIKKLPLASMSVFEGSGHLPFAEDSNRFNAELKAFSKRVFQEEPPID